MAQKLLNEILREVNAGTIASERTNGLVAKAFKDRNLKEYKEFMFVYRLLPKKHQEQIYKVLWPLFQKAFDTGYVIGKCEQD